MYKGKCWIVTTFLLMLIFYLSSCNNSNEIGTREESLSNYILGEWSGQVDVADIMYKELGDELGIDLSPEPEYCDVSISLTGRRIWNLRENAKCDPSSRVRTERSGLMIAVSIKVFFIILRRRGKWDS